MTQKSPQKNQFSEWPAKLLNATNFFFSTLRKLNSYLEVEVTTFEGRINGYLCILATAFIIACGLSREVRVCLLAANGIEAPVSSVFVQILHIVFWPVVCIVIVKLVHSRSE